MEKHRVPLVRTTVGNDPEFFYMSQRNTPIAAEKFLEPKAVTGHYVTKIYFDNAAIEFAIAPRSCLMELNNEISVAVDALRSRLSQKKLSTKSERISFRSAEKISKITLNKYDSVRMFACRPSLLLEGETHTVHHPEVNPFEELRRSAGFHVHIGEYDKKAEFNKQVTYAVKLCDLLAAIPAIFLDRDTERVQWRRQAIGYGVAGEFRIQPWGYEYRTLGSWPLSHPVWTWWANATVRMANSIAVSLIATDTTTELFNIDRAAVEQTINSNNINDARAIWLDVKKILSKEFVLNEAQHNISSTFLSTKNTAAVEFLIANGGLELTNGKFFEAWLEKHPRPSYGHIGYKSAYSGIQNTILNVLGPLGFEKFFKSYRFTDDYIV